MVLRSFLHYVTVAIFFCATVMPVRVNADALAVLPAPGKMVNLSPTFEPALIKGIKVHPDNPFLFDFIVDNGNSNLGIDTPAFKKESDQLIRYFLSALTIPEKDLWVNLSPYEKDRMIAPNLGQTQMGQDMLAQDYLLKQLTASMIYPEKGLGKEFWDKVYAQINSDAAALPIAMDAFNKVWIIADRADVYEGKNAAYVTGAHLKVLLETDYLAQKKAEGSKKTLRSQTQKQLGVIGSSQNEITQTLKQIVLPALEKEVNEGKNFAKLRQMYHSMILASWYKMRLKNALMSQVYGNRSKVSTTVNAVNPKDQEAIFQRYLQAYKKGVFNFIKEEIDPKSYQKVPRKYFSGGLSVRVDLALRTVSEFHGDVTTGDLAMVSSPMELKSVDRAQRTVLLVDDDNEDSNVSLMIFKFGLEAAGFNVLRARDGVEALAILAQGADVDAVSTDFNMPNMDGGQLIAKLRELDSRIPVFLRTGHSQEDEPEVQRIIREFDIDSGGNLSGVFDKVSDAQGAQLIASLKNKFPGDAAQVAKKITRQIIVSDAPQRDTNRFKVNGIQPIVVSNMRELNTKLASLRTIDARLMVVFNVADIPTFIESENIVELNKKGFAYILVGDLGREVTLHDPNSLVPEKSFLGQGAYERAMEVYQSELDRIDINLNMLKMVSGYLVNADPQRKKGVVFVIKLNPDDSLSARREQRASILSDSTLEEVNIVVLDGPLEIVRRAGGRAIEVRKFNASLEISPRAVKLLKKDQAMNVVDSLGGIDFNTGTINITKQGKGVSMQFDQAMIDRINARGFAGVDFRIDRIVPIFNLQNILDAG